jgi:formylglycine-generating enzyme required for sulfatase activity
MDWVAIPAGPFLLGSPPGEPETFDAEYPQHTVDLPLFYISRYPITCAQFRPFVEGDGYTHPAYWTPAGWAWRQGAEPDLTPLEGLDAATIRVYREWLARRPVEQRDRPRWWDDPAWNGANRPVVGVTWYEAAAYCRWLTKEINELTHQRINEIRGTGWAALLSAMRHAPFACPPKRSGRRRRGAG